MVRPTTPATPSSARFLSPSIEDPPIIDESEQFSDVVSKLSSYICREVDTPYTYEQFRTSVAGQSLKPLISSLSDDCRHPAIVAALLALRWVLTANTTDDTGLSESRALACELVAWQFLTYLSEKELIDYLLFELPELTDSKTADSRRSRDDSDAAKGDGQSTERTGLLNTNQEAGYGHLGPPKRTVATSSSDTQVEEDGVDSSAQDDLARSFAGMNTLEIAAVANAKKFLSQKPVQKIVEDLWDGEVIFWESLSVYAVKKARTYNKRVADPYARLRVPKYQKAFQIAFFLSFLALYYAVLVERNPYRITVTEILLYLWIAAYAYDEYGEFLDAGLMFYSTDFWSLWDIGIIGIGTAFFVTRVIGLIQTSDYTVDVSFDILSLEALFLVPRICSVMSLNPYFGSLIPVLKQMTKAFCKFLPVIIVLYLGFLTTFTMLARDRLTLNQMSWLLVKVFFGSSYLGFDIAVTISPLFGYPLMLIFVCLTNILLITSLVSLVSNSLTEVMAHAREEYLFQYSIYVMESSTSRRLTYFMPPLNLIPLLLLRPLRLFLPSETVRRIRILVLKATHLPFVAVIWAYENSRQLMSHRTHPPSRIATAIMSRPLSASQASLDQDRHSLRNRDARSALKAANRGGAGLDSSLTDDHPNHSALNSTENADLINLVQKLSGQVDSLTAMVAGQKKD